MRRGIATTVLFLTLITGVLSAADIKASPRVFGSCSVVQVSSAGRETRVELRLHLVNPNAQAISIERLRLITLRPVAAKRLPSPILLSAHGAGETTQEFTVPTPEYQFWQRGLRPALHLELRTEAGERLHETVRLNRVRLRKEQ
jgi:hypothetical protein